MIITTTIVPDTPAVLLAGDVLTLVTLLSQPGAPGVNEWGEITGTLSAQTDLQAELDGKAPALGADDNYVTDAEKVVIGNTSGTNTGDVIDWANPVAINTATTLTIGKHHVVTAATDLANLMPAVSGNAGKLVSWEIAAASAGLVTTSGNDLATTAAQKIDGEISRVQWSKENTIALCDGVTWTKIAGKSIPMYFRTHLTTNQSGIAGGYSVVNCDAEDEDFGGVYNNSTYRMVPRRDSLWHFDGTAKVSKDSGTNLITRAFPMLVKNGENTTPASQLVRGFDMTIGAGLTIFQGLALTMGGSVSAITTDYYQFYVYCTLDSGNYKIEASAASISRLNGEEVLTW